MKIFENRVKTGLGGTLMLAVGLSLCAILVIIILIATILKEGEFFWNDSGGYSVWLRHSILLFYYPVNLATGALLGFMTYYGAQLFRKSKKGLRLLGPCIIIWCLYGLAWGLCVADNVEEFIMNLSYGDYINF